MKDVKGVVLYVGKAIHLRNRVLSYFQKRAKRAGKKERYQIDFLMRRVSEIEPIITTNESEALLLENTLIKKYQPRYNLFLKDDKSYPSLKINLSHPCPGLFMTRNVVQDGSDYFGPYTSVSSLRETLDLLTKFFRLRTCSDHEFANRSRPCLKYDMGRCTAPCVGKVTPKEYKKQTEQVLTFLKGKGGLLLDSLKNEMKKASCDEQFEEAARLRDLIFYIQETLKEQKVVRHSGDHFDVIGIYEGAKAFSISILGVRNGILNQHKNILFQEPVFQSNDLIESFLFQYYGKMKDVPPKIIVPILLENADELGKMISTRIETFQKGEKAHWIQMACENARSQWELKKKWEMDTETLLGQLEKILFLPSLPHVIECVDISNLQGKEAVGVIIAFTDGKPDKQKYRRFKIRGEEKPNDYQMMQEVLTRRFQMALSGVALEKRKWLLPDLLLVDGGKGQLQIALKVLSDLGIHSVPVAAIAKERTKNDADKIYLPDRKNPVKLKAGAHELLYLMRIRDEAHRFAITYHRQRRQASIF